MITNDYPMENSSYRCTEYVCERTGIKIEKVYRIREPQSVTHHLIDGENYYHILETEVPTILKLFT